LASVCVCLCVRRAVIARSISLGGEGNALYPVLSSYPIGLLLSFGFRGSVTSSHVGNMPFSSSMVISRPKPVTYNFSGSLEGVSAGVTNVTMLWLPTKSTCRSTPRTCFCFSTSRFLVAVSSSAKLMTAYLHANTLKNYLSRTASLLFGLYQITVLGNRLHTCT